MNSFEFEPVDLPISYEASNWFFDLLPLNNSIPIGQDFWGIDIQDIQKAMGCTGAIDFAFAVDQHVLVAICLKERKVATYRYQGAQELCFLHTSNTSGTWIDVVGSVETTSWGGQKSSLRGMLESSLSPTCFLFVLTRENTVIKISIQLSDYSLVEEYSVTFDQQIKYKNILVSSKPQPTMGKKKQPDNAVYLWAPSNKILQNWHLYSDGTRELHREIRIKRPKWTAKEGTPEVEYDFQALTMCVDEMEDSVICADRTNHFLFECSLKTSHSEVLCGQGEPGRSEENTQTPLAFLNAPCSPLILRPVEFISLDQFGTSAKEVITAEKSKNKSYGKKPRLLLICDAGNHAVRKIWQFPASPQARDRAKLNRIYTMLSESKIAGCTGKLLGLHCGEPRRLFIGPSGRLTVTTSSSVYIVASHVAVYEERISGGMSLDS